AAHWVPDGGGAPSVCSVLTGASKMTSASPSACSDSALRCDCHRKSPPATAATATTTRATILTSSPCVFVQVAACSIPERNSSSLILCLSLLFMLLVRPHKEALIVPHLP